MTIKHDHILIDGIDSSETNQLSSERSQLVVDQLLSNNTVSSEQLRSETPLALARSALQDYQQQAELKMKRQSKDNGLVKTAKKSSHIARRWVDGASTDELREDFDIAGFKNPAHGKYDDWALRVFKSYAKLKTENMRATRKSTEEVLDQVYEWDESDTKDLSDTIYDLRQHPRIDDMYVKGLLLYFEKVTPEFPDADREDKVLRFTLPRLRVDASKFTSLEATTSVEKEGVSYIRQLLGLRHINVQSVTDFTAERYHHDELKTPMSERHADIARTESIVAHGLAALYSLNLEE